MNRINQLFDEKFVENFFKKRILPLYPDARDIVRIKIKPYKKLVWKTTYHVVLDFLVEFELKNSKRRKTHIVCSAHSSESRDLAFSVLQYLWKRRLGKGVVLPRPLFYCDYFKGYFYRALSGKNLYNYILERNEEKIIDLTARSGVLFARLHKLSLKGSLPKLHLDNAKIATVIPGKERINNEFRNRYNEEKANNIIDQYNNCIAIEEEYLSSKPKLCLVHGDAHTENILRVSKNKVGLIDFSDFCLGDFARDVGTFIQQLAYKLEIKYTDQDFIKKMKNLFLNEYLKEANIELDENLQKRLDNYYNWTALRTAAYWLMKDKAEPERAEAIFNHLKYKQENNFRAQD